MAETSTANTYNISSRATVFLKYFLPTIYTVFFGTLMVVFLFANKFQVGSMSPMSFKIAYVATFTIVTVVMYFSIFKLKRVELDDQFIYITNYIKIFRYPYENVEKVTVSDFGIWLVIRVRLVQSGHFGKKVTFLADRKRLRAYLAEHPERAVDLKLPDGFSLEK